jgi:hypothetical protein
MKFGNCTVLPMNIDRVRQAGKGGSLPPRVRSPRASISGAPRGIDAALIGRRRACSLLGDGPPTKTSVTRQLLPSTPPSHYPASLNFNLRVPLKLFRDRCGQKWITVWDGTSVPHRKMRGYVEQTLQNLTPL